MTVQLMVDCEALVSAWLRDNDDVTALIDDHVYTQSPRNSAAKMPYARVTRIGGGGPVIQHPLWLDTARLQVDVFGGAKVFCLQIAETIRAACAQDLPGVHTLGVVTNVDLRDSPAYQPDDTFDPPTPRYRFDMSITTHP